MPRYRKTPRVRHDLPNRRLTENRKITTLDSHKFYLSIGYDPNDPVRPREVFYSAGFKSGSALEFQVEDSCVLISMHLQKGETPETIGKSLARVERADGNVTYASLTGLIVEELGKPPGWA